MTWSIGNESRCVVRNLTHGIDKTADILEFEPKQKLVIKINESSILEMLYVESTKMYQCVLGKNVFVSLGPDWRVDYQKDEENG